LQEIDNELETIADDVRQNITSLFKRGEKMSNLEEKSQGIKYVAKTLKSRSQRLREGS
jgi:hypothetical protein